MATDLFGNELTPGVEPETKWESNDLDLVISVVETAMRDGYTRVGVKSKVYRRVGDSEIEPVPEYEAAMVDQLLSRGWLSLGGHRSFTYGRYSGRGQSVLVPRGTRDRIARWKALVKLPTQRAGHVRNAATGRPARTAAPTRRTKTRKEA